VRVSVASDGHQAGGASSDPTISDDGDLIAFASTAFDLVADDNNGAQDVFVRDLVAGTTARVSVSITGSDADLRSQDPVISGDGLHVAFSSAAINIVPGDGNGVADVFVRDLAAGTTARASVSSTGGEANAASNAPALSRDGRFVSFVSAASNLVAPPATISQLFVRDTQAPTTTRPTVSSTNAVSWGRLSGDGRYLVEQASSGVLLVDRLAGVSLNVSGGNTWSWPVVSGNGRYVVVLDARQGGSVTVIPNPR
jgi:Tol biopolymer transport system component